METHKVWIVVGTYTYPYQGDEKVIHAVFDSKAKAEEYVNTKKQTSIHSIDIEVWNTETGEEIYGEWC